jgi:hypothetical protein
LCAWDIHQVIVYHASSGPGPQPIALAAAGAPRAATKSTQFICYTESMPALLHPFLLTLAVVASYWWVSLPELNMYSLQAMAYVALVYFLLKRLTNAKFWHIVPAALSIETVLATFGFLILVGSTGNTNSLLFPLSYIHLFFIAFSSSPLTSIIITLEVMLFHYALTPNFSNPEIVAMMSLPLMMLFFLFAKRQHEEIIRDQMIIKEEHNELTALSNQDVQVGGLLHAIQSKLSLTSQLLDYPQANQGPIRGQLNMIQLEMEKLQQYLKKRWFMLSTTDKSHSSPYEKHTI